MPGKIKKIKTILNNKTKLRSAVGQILYEEKAAKILSKYGVTSFPAIKLSELFSLYSDYDLSKSVHIRTDFTSGSSPVNDYYVLCHLVNALKAKNYFEIGTWVGISARNIADNTGDYMNIYTLDIPHDHQDLKQFNIPKHIFGYHSEGTEKIHHLKGDSMTYDFSPYQKKMDMIFVDGNHSFEYLVSDSKNALDMLRDDSSVIVWHDYLSAGEINKDVLCGMLEGIPEPEHKHLFHLHQSNVAVYSKSFNFNPAPIGKWDIPEILFDVEINMIKEKK